jgi:hypothetical protein
MFAAASQLVPLAAKFCRQIVPPVLATLIAAGLISAYNRAFSGHLQQPRMSALHEAQAAADTVPPITTVAMNKPAALPAPPVTETITIYEEAIAPERLTEKEAGEESAKDQAAARVVVEPGLAPAAVRTATPAPRVEPRAEAPHVAAAELPPPVVRAPVPVIVAVAPPPVVAAPGAPAPVIATVPPAQQPYPPQPYPQYQPPPPVIVGSAPMVTVPDRPSTRPIEEAQMQAPPPQSAIGKFVHAMKPSTWFAAARQFGDKIEAAGNDILPNIRQQ